MSLAVTLGRAIILLLQLCVAFEVCMSVLFMVRGNRPSDGAAVARRSCQAMLSGSQLPLSRNVKSARGSRWGSCSIHHYQDRSDFDTCFGSSIADSSYYSAGHGLPRLIFMEGDSRMRGFFDALVSRIDGTPFKTRNSPLVHLRPYNVTSVWIPRYNLRIVYHYARLFEHTTITPNISHLIFNATKGHQKVLMVFNLALDSLFPGPRYLTAFNETTQNDFRGYVKDVLLPWAVQAKVVWMDIPPTNPPYGNNGLNQEISRFNVRARRIIHQEFPLVYTFPSEWNMVENLNTLGDDQVFSPDGYHTTEKVDLLCAELLVNLLCNERLSIPGTCCVASIISDDDRDQSHPLKIPILLSIIFGLRKFMPRASKD